MLKNLFIVIFCATIFYQSLATNDVKTSKDDVKKAFHKMMAAVDKALTQAQAALNKAMDQVKAKATELENKANTELDKTLNPLRAKLNKEIEEAKKKGFDITKCQKYVDDFNQTPNTLTHNLIECFNTQISRAQNYVNDALNNAKKIEQDLNSIDADIDKCGTEKKWKQVKCYAKLLEQIAKDTKEAPQHIAEDVAKATALVTQIVPILEACFTDQLKKAGDDATKDVTDFALCAAIPVVQIV